MPLPVGPMRDLLALLIEYTVDDSGLTAGRYKERTGVPYGTAQERLGECVALGWATMREQGGVPRYRSTPLAEEVLRAP